MTEEEKLAQEKLEAEKLEAEKKANEELEEEEEVSDDDFLKTLLNEEEEKEDESEEEKTRRKNKDAEEARKRREAEAKKLKEAEELKAKEEAEKKAKEEEEAKAKEEESKAKAELEKKAREEADAEAAAKAKKNEVTNKLGAQLTEFKAKYPDVDLASLDKDPFFMDWVRPQLLGKKDFTGLYEEYNKKLAEVTGKKVEEVTKNYMKARGPGSSKTQQGQPVGEVYSEAELLKLAQKMPQMKPEEYDKIKDKYRRSITFYDKK